MSYYNSAIAGYTPQGSVPLTTSQLIFSTEFAGSCLGVFDSESETASYHQFFQYMRNIDPITGYSWDSSSIDDYYGTGDWAIQSLTNFLGSSYNKNNIISYIGASTSEIPGNPGRYELEIACKQKNGSIGAGSPPQCWLLRTRYMSGNTRLSDVPVILYEFDCVMPATLPDTLVAPTLGTNGTDWYNWFEIKSGMCNNGLYPDDRNLSPDVQNAGDCRLAIGVRKNPNTLRLQYVCTLDDGANNSSPYFDIPGVSTLGTPTRTIRERFTDASGIGEIVKVKIYIKRPASNADRSSGRLYVSVTPKSTNEELVVAKWEGGEQIGVQSGPMERFLLGAYSGGYAPYSSKIRSLKIYKGWVYDYDPFSYPKSYMDATFYAPFTNTMESKYGRGSSEFSRASSSYAFNNEGVLVLIPSGCPRFKGARYVQNLLTSTSILATQSITVEINRIYTISFYDTGSIVFSGVYTGSTLTGSDLNTRVQRTFTATNSGSITLTVSGSCINAQLEDVTGNTDKTASEYVSAGVLTAPYYHGCMVDGIKAYNTNKDTTAISSSVLRGLQIDPAARTNSTLWCRDFTQASWVKTNIASALTQTGIDGKVSSASLLTATATNGTVLQSITAAATAGCLSMYIKRNTGVGTVSITRDNGSTWVDITSQINNVTFSLVSIENTSVLNPIVGIKIATNGDAIIVDYVKNELGSDVSEPSYTAGSTSTRALEIARVYKNNNCTNGSADTSTATWLMTVERHNWAVSNGSVAGDANSGIFTSSANSGVIVKDGTNTVNGPSGVPNGQLILGMRYQGSSFEAFSNGVWSSPGTYDGSMLFSTYIEFGKAATCTVRDVAIWNQEVLTNPQVLEVIA